MSKPLLSAGDICGYLFWLKKTANRRIFILVFYDFINMSGIQMISVAEYTNHLAVNTVGNEHTIGNSAYCLGAE